MKKKRFSGILALGCCSLFFLSGPARVEAESYARTSHTEGTWSATNRWTPAGAPLNEGDVAIINAGSSLRTITLNVNPTILGIDLNDNWVFNNNDLEAHSITLRAHSGASPYFYVAANATGGIHAHATLELQQGVTISLEGGRFLLGTPQVAGRGSSGQLTVASGAGLNIGTEAHRSQWLVAQHYTTRREEAESSVTANAGATVSAWLTELQVGNNHGTGNGSTIGERRITGTLDLREATVSAFDISGDMVIGSGAHHIRGSDGKVLLRGVEGQVGGKVLVGDHAAQEEEYFRSSGLLDLDDTRLKIKAGGSVAIDETGRVRVTVREGGAGLQLSADVTLTINAVGTGAGDENAGYFIDFTDAAFSDDGLLYGLAWEGDRQSDLTTLIGSHAITWSAGPDGLTAGLFYDAGADLTYIGIAPIPEPGTVSLLLGGAVLLGWAARKKAG